VSAVFKVLPDDATNTKVTWKSENMSVVGVDEFGSLIGVEEGTAKVTVTTDEGKFIATTTVTVTPPKPKPACPEWKVGVNYKTGTVVSYKEVNYTSNNDWTGSAPDPYTATHSGTGWGWTIGGNCNGIGFVESNLRRVL
jgi:uncharacterized protein YjdB